MIRGMVFVFLPCIVHLPRKNQLSTTYVNIYQNIDLGHKLIQVASSHRKKTNCFYAPNLVDNLFYQTSWSVASG